MDELKFDVTTEQGMKDTISLLKKRATNSVASGAIGSVKIDIDFKPLLDFLSQIYNRIIDLFDDTKKLEKQMEFAKQTIKFAKELGAKSIELTIDTKNSNSLSAFIKEINAKVEVKVETGSKTTYNIQFA